MLKLETIRALFRRRERRVNPEPVPACIDRRKMSRAAADQKLLDAVDDLERTIRMRREDFLK